MNEFTSLAMTYFDVTGPLAWFLALWFLALGGGIGSFMNVVVYRSPRGLSVSRPRSRCPRCGSGIAWYDNVPVLSWLALGGRCRCCREPISRRYPMVEALVATVFFCVAARELMTNGANFDPLHPSPRFVPATLFITYFAQMLALSALICAALIEYDGLRMPKRLLIAPVIALTLASPWLPELPLPMPPAGLLPGANDVKSGFQLQGGALPSDARSDIWNGLVGAAAGLVLGFAARRRENRGAGGHPSEPRSDSFVDVRPRTSPELELALVGVVLGWQMTALIASAAASIEMIAAALWSARLTSRRLPWNWLIAAGLFFGIIFFQRITFLVPAVVRAGPELLLAGVGVTWAASRLSSFCRGREPTLSDFMTSPNWDTPPGKTNPESPMNRQPNLNVEENLQAILESPSYRIAAYDDEFLRRAELRPIRLQLELLKPELAFVEHKIRSTIVVFGGTQVIERADAERRVAELRERTASSPEDAALARELARMERIVAKSHYYDAAREFGRLVSTCCQVNGECDYVIITGGGPGIMEAANRGAFEVGAKTVGLNITLPQEQRPNPYITPELCFQFHYFALRKMHFLLRAKALVVFPGGFGTLDELFDALTLRQTRRMQAIPIILFGRDYWRRVVDFQFLADEGVIADEHLNLIDYAETPEEAWDIVCRFHNAGNGTSGSIRTSSESNTAASVQNP